MEFVGQTTDGHSIRYVDKKRYLWLLSLSGVLTHRSPLAFISSRAIKNTNHIFSNLLTFHLQRHSDHHANALRPYQTLRNFEELPRLPSGYPGSFGLAAFPSQWFKVMDPKLMRWAGGDITKLNVDPDQRDRLYAKFGGR